MSFKPSDANVIVDGIFDDLIKILKKRVIKSPESTTEHVNEQMALVELVLSRVSEPSKKRKSKDCKTKSKKKSKTDSKDGAQPQESKDPQEIALA